MKQKTLSEKVKEGLISFCNGNKIESESTLLTKDVKEAVEKLKLDINSDKQKTMTDEEIIDKIFGEFK